jgi:hypothetical protein
MILDNNDLDKSYTRDKAKGAISNINTRYIKRDISLYNILITLELVLKPIKSINISCLWDNIKDGYYINGPVLGLGSC